MTAFANKVTLGFTSDIKNLVPMLGVFKPTIVVSVPGCSKRSTTQRELNAQDSGRGRISRWRSRPRSPGARRRRVPGARIRCCKGRHAVFDRLVYGKLRAALGGTAMPPSPAERRWASPLGHFYRGVGLSIYEGYGLTETSAAITVNRIGELKVGTVGKLVPGNSMAIAEDGELLVRGGVVFSGYWRNQKATDEAIVDGWFHTGDLGSIDDEGFLSITGRKKEIIVTAGGKNVAPPCSRTRCGRIR